MTKTFAQIFGLHDDQAQLDFVNITPNADLPLFIDPFALSNRNDAWSEACHLHITHFFQTALDYIRAGDSQSARELLNGLSEPNETCLGLSRGRPQGRGVSGKQALDLYDSLAQSHAARSGLLEELADCDLFVRGIGRDKISDITTNIIRRLLIEYTQLQCDLHGVKLTGTYPTGRFWDINARQWRNEYQPLPVVNDRRIILVPKYSVRRTLVVNARDYYTHYILNFLRDEGLASNISLVRTLNTGRRVLYKRDLKKQFPFSKEFIASFSRDNPDVLRQYKSRCAQLDSRVGPLRNTDFDENLDEKVFAETLIASLASIAPGKLTANRYHSIMIGVLQFLFWPHLINPRKETPLHDGRKRIDITYTNAAHNGVFFRAHTAHQIASNLIMVECKNYTKDPHNPEIDQLAGRFSTNRGKLGILIYRDTTDYDMLLQRCRDTANDGRGFILPIGDRQIIECLQFIAAGERHAIDRKIDQLLTSLIC